MFKAFPALATPGKWLVAHTSHGWCYETEDGSLWYFDSEQAAADFASRRNRELENRITHTV